MTTTTPTPVNSIEIPAEYLNIAGAWHDGQSSMLYAISSSGSLMTGTHCPVTEYSDEYDKQRKWYLLLWNSLSVDLGFAVRAANKSGGIHMQDTELLEEFEKYTDDICERLAVEYGLEDWEA